MLKNLLAVLVFVFLGSASAYSQNIIVTPSDTLTLDTVVTHQTERIMIYNMKNNTATDSVFRWRLVYNTFPHCWVLGFCDPITCYSPIPVVEKTYNLSPGATTLMQLDLTDTCASGCGEVQVLTWAVGDSANTATYLNYRACFNVVTGISEVDAPQVSIYPNPVRNELKVSLSQNLQNGQIDIFNLLGSKVYSQPINGQSSKEFDLSELETGLYIARVSEGGRVIATRKFTKED